MAASNTVLNPTIIAKEALMMLENSMVMGRTVHTQYIKEFAKVGNSIRVRKPNKFRATETNAGSTATRVTTDMAESYHTFAFAKQAHVSWAFTSQELTLDIEEYSERYIKPAAMALANVVDVALCTEYNNVFNEVGTPGTTPSTFAALGAAQQRLDEDAAPSTDRYGILNPAANWALADGLKGTFAAKQASDILTKGYLGTIANLDLHMDQNIQSHTAGHFATGSVPVMDGATVTDATTLLTDGWGAAGTILNGDVFTVADCYSCNPVSGDSTGALMQWVVTADTEDDGGGHVTIPISPTVKYAATIADGMAYNNIVALPGDGKAVTFMGTEDTVYPQNLIYHKNAFGLITLPLAMPSGVWGARETYNGLSIRIVKQYDITSDEDIVRLDILYGTTTLYPELACRLTG